MPRVHDDDAVGHLHRFFLVVRHDHRRRVRLVVQAAKPGAQLLAHPRVERAERLVEQQDLRVDGECACQSHALALSARKLCWIPLCQPLELDELEQLVDTLVDLCTRPATYLEAEGDVVAHGHVLERGVMLEDEADAAFLRWPRGHVVAVEQDGPRVGTLEPGDHSQKRRLPAPARPEQRGQRSGRHLDGNIVQRDEVAEALGDSPCLDHRVSSLGRNRFIRSSVRIAISASRTEPA